MGEKDILIARRGKEELEKKVKEALKDNDSYQYKVRTLGKDKPSGSVRGSGRGDGPGQEGAGQGQGGHEAL